MGAHIPILLLITVRNLHNMAVKEGVRGNFGSLVLMHFFYDIIIYISLYYKYGYQ